MNFLIKIILLICICAKIEALHVENKNEDELVPGHHRKPKQYMQFDGVQAQPMQQQPSLLPGLGQLPIIGTLVGNLPGLVGGLPQQLGTTVGGLFPGQLGTLIGGLPNQLGGLVGSLPVIGGLTQNLGLGGNQGGLLNPGGLLNLGGLFGQQVGTANGLTCPVTQKLNCKCEPLLGVRPFGHKLGGLEILQHMEQSNDDGTKELSAILSNGLIIYQRSGVDKDASNQDVPTTQGFYSLKLKEQRYLTIYFTINDSDYTVKADVRTEPPRTDVVGKQKGSFV